MPIHSAHSNHRGALGRSVEADRTCHYPHFREYAERWIANRTNRRGQPLSARTREEYERYLDDRLAEWAETPLTAITSDGVREWYSRNIADGKETSTARQYDFFKSVLKTALEDDLIPRQPCTIRGGSKAKTGVDVSPPTDDELHAIIRAFPSELRHVILIAAAAGLRIGEILLLTTDDVTIIKDENNNVDAVVIAVTKGVVTLKGGKRLINGPKSIAGVRTVSFLGQDAKDVASHVEAVEPGQKLTEITYAGVRYHWLSARNSAGREDLHFHSLRHYSGTRFAQAGATLAEIMARLGHSSVSVAMAYQHAADSRMDEIARRASRR